MTSWLHTIAEKTAQHGAVVRVAVARTDGSVPREAGAAMVVTAGDIEGTIGGGALELQAINAARAMLASAGPEALWVREMRDYPLGPSLGQCCGGYAKLLLELYRHVEVSCLEQQLAALGGSGFAVRPLESGAPLRILAHRKEAHTDLPLNALRIAREMLSGQRPSCTVFLPASKSVPAWFIEPLGRPKTPLFLYGAGHVGRALIRVLEGLPFEIAWVDTSEDRFPDWAGSINCIVARDPASVAVQAPEGAFHVVMTYSHPLDLAICHAVLTAGSLGFLGLIGSRTKHARFIKRLRELGHSQGALDRLTCPIGISGITGKEPAIIAVSVAAQLLRLAAEKNRTANFHPAAGAAK